MDLCQNPTPQRTLSLQRFPASSRLRFLPNAGSISARPASVKRGRGVAMAIGKPRRRTVDSPMIHSRTRCELTLVVILSVLTIFLFPSMQGPYSVVRGPATAFRAARSAAIAHASIVQGAMHSIRNSPGSPPRALNCTRHQSVSMHIAAAIPNINEVFW